MTQDPNYFMELAYHEATLAGKNGDVPVGAIIVKDGNIIAKAFNATITKNDPSAHAEVEAIRIACNEISNYRLSGTQLFVTLEPCMMCYGTIIHSRISKIYFGAYDKKTGVCGSCFDASKINCFNQSPEITGGILEKKCSKILKDFFKSKRS